MNLSKLPAELCECVQHMGSLQLYHCVVRTIFVQKTWEFVMTSMTNIKQGKYQKHAQNIYKATIFYQHHQQ